jgi:OOP family OmpA-OmpF porin
MRKQLLVLSFLAASFTGYSQTRIKDTVSDRVEENPLDSYNRWTIEAGAGQSKGIKPYANGYYSSNPNKHFALDVNHFHVGARYMASPTFGIRGSFSYDNLSNLSGSESLPFEMQLLSFRAEGVVNAVRLLNFEERAGRFGMLLHAGFQVSQMSPQMGANEGRDEYNGGFIFGVTPQLRVFKSVGIYADFAMNSNIRQHFNWDGSYSDRSNNLAGSMFTFALGVSVSFGNQDLHGDWAVIPDSRTEQIRELDERLGELETMMNDSDKDGVPDYLDVEPNSIAGVAVDSKGRMVDLNKNGVADELEKYMDAKINTAVTDSNNSEVVKRLINEGYVSVFFDFNSTKPTAASTQNISFVLTYLKNNPDATVDIQGFADEIGSTDYNNALSGRRADTVRDILVKAGISASRINIVPQGEDTSVDKDSDAARRLVRRATFTIK